MGIENRKRPGISWSAMRKTLEQDNICASLKGRIQYFQTNYRGAHDQTGRAAIRLDGKEIFQCDYFKSSEKYYNAWHNIKEEQAIETADQGYRERHEQAKLVSSNQVGTHYFYNSFYTYHNNSIEKSLASSDPVVRLFAILDKRVGKRRLEKLVSEVRKQPEWLQFFYKLRLEAEGISEKTQEKRGKRTRKKLVNALKGATLSLSLLLLLPAAHTGVFFPNGFLRFAQIIAFLFIGILLITITVGSGRHIKKKKTEREKLKKER